MKKDRYTDEVTWVRRMLAIVAVVTAVAWHPALAQQPQPEAGTGIALLPLRSRGLSPAEHRRIAMRVAASYRQSRQDVIAPEDLGARLSRDERRRSALEEARKLVAEGAEKSLNMESAAAVSAYDRALAIWRENFGEWVDAANMADAYVRRAAERMDSDPGAARADLFEAVTIAPDRSPSLDDFPPKVVEAHEAARLERAKDSFRSDDPRALAALGAALGTASVGVTRAERGDRIEEGVGVELAVFAVRVAEKPKTVRGVLPGIGDGGMERIDSMVDSLAGRGTPITLRDDVGTRPNPARTPPAIQRPRRPGERPLWKNPWIWVGTGAAVIAGAGLGVYSMQQEKDEGPGFKVILAPAPPDDS